LSGIKAEAAVPQNPDLANAIEIRVDNISQLFNTLDPFPFRERDLDREVEDYITSWAREVPAGQPLTILVHYPDTESQQNAAAELGIAIDRHFFRRAELVQRDLNEMFRVGRIALAIGISILVACFGIAHVVAGLWPTSTLTRLIEESFLILGWVANWRPLEIFLYDWWPLARRRRLYQRLAQARVQAKPYASAARQIAASS
jgi:hypothetical protein